MGLTLKHIVAVICFILTVSLHGVTSLKCYSCLWDADGVSSQVPSMYNQHCSAGSFQGSAVNQTECPSACVYLTMDTTVKGMSNVGKDHWALRSCGHTNVCNDFYQSLEQEGHLDITNFACNTCNSDLCNSGRSLEVSLLLTLPLLALHAIRS